MLIEFKVANYRSIRAEQTLSMVASNYSDELPQNLISCDHVPGLKGTKLVKAVALYGANASGKSNIVAALRFFAEFVRDSATQLQPGAPTGAQPFKLDPACLTEPSKFEITAVINGIRTLYGIEMTRERVTSEYLVAYPKGRPQVWFERDWDEGKGKYVWSKSTEHFKHDGALRGKTRDNATFLSVAAQFNHELAATIQEWFQRIQLLAFDRGYAIGGAARRLLAYPQSIKTFGTLLKMADTGVCAVKARFPEKEELNSELSRAAKITDAPTKSFHVLLHALEADKLPEEAQATLNKAIAKHPLPELVHTGADNSEVSLEFFTEESSGTRRFFELYTEIAMALSGSSVMLADELETSLHPALFREVIEFFLNSEDEPDDPPARAQLLFTTHNPLLLDQTLLRRDQIWFTEKDQEGATRLYPLTDFKPRKDESLVKGYLAGRYGGIPFIPEGLKF